MRKTIDCLIATFCLNGTDSTEITILIPLRNIFAFSSFTRAISGSVLVFPAPRGSSSGSAVVLELLARGKAPTAIVLGQMDAILGIGIVVAGQLGIQTIPLLELTREKQEDLQNGDFVQIDPSGRIIIIDQGTG